MDSMRRHPVHSKRPTESHEISRYDRLECLHMDAGTFLESLGKLQALIQESSPVNPRRDVEDEEEEDDIIVQIPREAWDQIGLLASEHTKVFEDLMEKWEEILNANIETDIQFRELEEKLKHAERMAKEQDIEQRRENELQKVALNLREEQYARSLTEIKECFDKGKKTFNEDLVQMEKMVRRIRKSRRKFRAQQLTVLNQKQLELEDMLSSSDEPLDNYREEDGKEGTESEYSIPMIRMGLGGVPLKENGEPLELTASAKWDNDYDDTNSLESSGFLEFAHNHPAYINAGSTVDKNFIRQLLSEEYKKLTSNNENATRSREERKETERMTSQPTDPALNFEPTEKRNGSPVEIAPTTNLEEFKEDTHPHKDIELNDLLEISGPKFDEPLPLLPNGQKSVQEKLHHITSEEMLGVEMESSLPFSMTGESSKDEAEINTQGIPPEKAINVIDYNGSGKEVVTGHHLSMDNEELIPEDFEEIKYGRRLEPESNPQNRRKLEVIQENNSETSNSNSLISGRSVRHNRKQCNLAIDHVKGIPTSMSNRSKGYDSYSIDEKEEEELNMNNKRQNNSFCSAREPHDAKGAKFIRKYRAKSYRDRCNRSEIVSSEAEEKEEEQLEISGKGIEEIKDQQKPFASGEKVTQNFHSSNSISMNGIKTINTLPRGTGECSTTYTIEPVGKGQYKKPLQKLDPNFLAQMAGECKGTDHLALSTAGVLFGAGPLSGYIGLPTAKGTMFQSFSTNKPTLPSGLSSNMKQITGNSSSITIKRLDDSSECSGILKIRKKNIIPLNQSPDTASRQPSKLHLIMQPPNFQDEIEGKRRNFKRLKIKKGNL